MNSSLLSRFSRQKARHVLKIGPFLTSVTSDIAGVDDGIRLLYSDYSRVNKEDHFVDFYVELKAPTGLRRWYRPQVNFYFDGKRPFKPLSQDQAFAMFEWGLNWCITTHAHQFLIVHAAVVEKNGKALIMPGAPGAGKSTLCAGLISRGWRLLSDEMTLIPVQGDLQVVPVPRPVSLKNQSIDVIKSFNPESVFGSIAYDTAKGTVSHMKPPRDSVARSDQVARPGLVIFPKFLTGAESSLVPRTKAASFMEIARQSFNYNALGGAGFDTLSRLISEVDCYEFRYSSLDQAIGIMDELVADGEQVIANA